MIAIHHIIMGRKRSGSSFEFFLLANQRQMQPRGSTVVLTK